ncbi:MAG: flagellar hook-length control protein FliK [Halanaerobacter sp.]
MPAEMTSFNLSNLNQLKRQFSTESRRQTSSKSSSDFISSLQQEQTRKQQYQTNNRNQKSQSSSRNQESSSDGIAREDRAKQKSQPTRSDSSEEENKVNERKQQNEADKQVRNEEQTSRIEERKTKSDKLESKLKEKGIISEEELDRVKKLLSEDLEELSDKDLEALLANLTKMLEKLSQQLEEAKLKSGETEVKSEKDMLNKEQIEKLMKSITANQEKLEKLVNAFNGDESKKFKSLLKELESMQEKLLSDQMQQSKEGDAKAEAELKSSLKDSLDDLKRLFQKTNAKVVQSSTNSENSQNLSKQKILSQFNLAELNQKQKNAKAKKESSLSQVNLKDLGKEIGEKLLKKESINLKDLSSKQQNVDLKTVTKKNDSGNFNLSDFNLGQFNTDAKVFTQESTTKSMAAKTLNFQNILEQMNNKVNFSAIKEGNKVTMQLEPEFLGKIQMKVGVEDGAVTAKVLAESNGVKELLNGNLTRLKSALADKGIEIDQFDVSVGYQGEGATEDNSSSQQEFLFRQQQERNKMNKFSLEGEGQSLITEVESGEEEMEIVDDKVDYMA